MYLEIVAAMQNPDPNVIYNKWQQMSICFYAQILLTAAEPLTYFISLHISITVELHFVARNLMV